MSQPSINRIRHFSVILLLTASIFTTTLVGCVSSRHPASSSIGTVIQVDGDLVLVTFPVMSKGYADQAANWFLIPGHNYFTGDRYPDPKKDPNLKTPSKP